MNNSGNGMHAMKITIAILGGVSTGLGSIASIVGPGFKPEWMAVGVAIGAVCHAVSSSLSQTIGQSDEQQGITPAQKQAVTDIHAASIPNPAIVQPIPVVVPSAPLPGTAPAPVVSVPQPQPQIPTP